MKLIIAIGDIEMSVKEMLNVLELKERKSFISLYLNPAINEGYVSMLYPDSPAIRDVLLFPTMKPIDK